MTYEADATEERTRSSKYTTFITHHPFVLTFQAVSFCYAGYEAKELFCVNSVIRRTLMCGSHPLFLFILVGKYFIDFCSNRNLAELREALCGIKHCGGYLGRERRVFSKWSVCVQCASVGPRGDIPQHISWTFFVLNL